MGTSFTSGVTALAILTVSLLLVGIATSYQYRTVYNSYTGHLDYYAEYTSSDNLTAQIGNFTGGIYLGSGVIDAEGAMKYESNAFTGYNGTDWVALAGGADTNAGTICNNGEFLNGDGTCDAGYLDADGSDDDTPDNDSEVPNDITIAATGKNVTTTGAIVSDADDEGYWDGDGQDFHMYFNGTCELMIVGTTTLAICP